ncbi:MAG: hypothetical protein PF518_12765 [Spirochaetaceae bacterium]|nr:hypothetical protein [Spirochaetaceae bacterium]
MENVCPLSGLSITVFPEWDNIEITKNYSVSFIQLGENIFLSIPKGNSENEGMARFINCRKEFLKYTGLYDKEHIELKDYSAITGKVSKENRQLFTNMMETSLDILSHDTKNHFISLKYEINQINETNLKSSIHESVIDIQELIMEATGIMSSKKRIISIEDLIENIKVTSKRIPLMIHYMCNFIWQSILQSSV